MVDLRYDLNFGLGLHKSPWLLVVLVVGKEWRVKFGCVFVV